MPTGKGMWIYEFPRTEGGNMDAIVAKAKATGITHVYPRMGSHWDGFNARQYLDAFLPVAHAAGLKVFGWDFPRLGDSLPSDIERARTMINYTSPSGDRLDGFSADIETINEGSHVSPEVAAAYGKALREIAGPDFTLIATVPRPSPRNRPNYPYGEIVESFDAIAPMIYWLNRQPDTDVVGAMDELAKFGKPVFPVGQAYDGRAEGGRAGVPPPEELQRFMRTAARTRAPPACRSGRGRRPTARPGPPSGTPPSSARERPAGRRRGQPLDPGHPESKRHKARSRRLRLPSGAGDGDGGVGQERGRGAVDGRRRDQARRRRRPPRRRSRRRRPRPRPRAPSHQSRSPHRWVRQPVPSTSSRSAPTSTSPWTVHRCS